MNKLKQKIGAEEYEKLKAIDDDRVHEFIREYVELCNPKEVFICSDTEEEFQEIREKAIEQEEEYPLAIDGHTIHFDGYHDQARDKENTKFLVGEGEDMGPFLKSTNREKGVQEVKEYLRDSMSDRRMYILFFTLGPRGGEFAIPAIQITDSNYVAHSEHLLYRPGYEQFKNLNRDQEIFRLVHSTADLDLDKRRIYIDVPNRITYSTNTTYGGNTIGLKKLSHRLAIDLAYKEGWLSEHMFIVGVNGPGDRRSYFTGAFPSGCGKTSTSMMRGETIIGDDLAYLRIKDGQVRAANPERGVFGIIGGVNSKEEPILWETLHNPGEIIFSNVLITEDNHVYWEGADGETPGKGYNHSGKWHKGKKDENGNEIPPSHKNARFTFKIKLLDNQDPNLNNPEGVPIKGMIYGGRDSHTSVPVKESFNWQHGVITMGASLESETTAATLGKQGVVQFNPMSNLDFISIPLGDYIQNNLDFGKKAESPPHIFAVNYFLRNENEELVNAKTDKQVWLRWMEKRAHDEIGVVEGPTGNIPRYEDLKELFSEVLDKEYPEEDYVEQFTIRVNENLERIERIWKKYEEKIPSTPEVVFEELEKQKKRLLEARKKHGDYISPFKLAE